MIKNFFDKLYPKFEHAIVLALSVTLMIMIIYAAFIYMATLIVAIIDPGPIAVFERIFFQSDTLDEPIESLQRGLFKVFGGFLLILLGFELIGTVKTFARESHVKVESIVIISIIATARHLIIMDYHHTDPIMILAMGFVIFTLIISYCMLRGRSIFAHRDATLFGKKTSEQSNAEANNENSSRAKVDVNRGELNNG